MLYELLSGELPYPRLGNPVAELQQRIKHDPVPLGERAPYLPAALTAITERALRRDPAERFASAAELAATIAAAADVEWHAPAPRPQPPTDEPTLIDTVTGDSLLERDRERAALSATVAAAREGHGAVALLDLPGSASRGCWRRSCRRDSAVGARTLRARGGEMERDFPYGVVRQLLAREVRDLDGAKLSGAARLAGTVLGFEAPDAQAFGDAEREFALCHGLYWLICDLAESQPLILVVDDLHHVDPPSLRFLLYLTRRLQGLRIAICRRPARRGLREHRAPELRVRRARDPPARPGRRRGRALHPDTPRHDAGRRVRGGLQRGHRRQPVPARTAAPRGRGRSDRAGRRIRDPHARARPPCGHALRRGPLAARGTHRQSAGPGDRDPRRRRRAATRGAARRDPTRRSGRARRPPRRSRAAAPGRPADVPAPAAAQHRARRSAQRRPRRAARPRGGRAGGRRRAGRGRRGAHDRARTDR